MRLEPGLNDRYGAHYAKTAVGRVLPRRGVTLKLSVAGIPPLLRRSGLAEFEALSPDASVAIEAFLTLMT